MNREPDAPSAAMPDTYDRLLGSLHGLPDVTNTKLTTIRTITPMLGTSESFTIQTYRQRDRGDTIFLECISKDGFIRLAIPPAVSEAIARQRDALTGKVRSKAAKATAAARKAAGQQPGFMKNRRPARGN
jgi:hypothetical protein